MPQMSRSGILRRLRRRPRGRGQAVVEFALILPVFLLLTVGVVDMARVFIAYVSLENGVREAAVYAAQSASTGNNFLKWCTDPANKAASPAVSVPCPATATGVNKSPDPDNIAYRIDAAASGMDANLIVLSPPTTTVDTNCDSILHNDGKRVTITATYTFRLLTPIVSSLVSTGIVMSTSTSTCVF